MGKVHHKQKKKAVPLAFTGRYPNIIPYAILFMGAFLVYGWTAGFDFGLDDHYILNTLKLVGNNIQDAVYIFYKRFGTADYRPVVMLSFWLERFLFGSIDPNISHFINVLVFGFLLTRIYAFVLAAGFYEDSEKLRVLAMLCCLVFLLHPNHVSVVANIKSRDSLLSMLFGLISTIQFIRMINTKAWGRFVWVVVFFLLAFLSKKDAYIFAVLPVLYYIIYRKVNRRLIAFLIIGSFIVWKSGDILKDYMFTNLVGQENMERMLIDSPLRGNDTYLHRFALSCLTMLYYLKFLIVPWGYHFYFGYNQVPLLPLFHPLHLLSLLLYISIGAACLYMYKKEKIYWFSFLFFLLGIVYAANMFVPVAGVLMDRYNFIASLGFCLGISALIIHFTSVKNVFRNRWVILLLLVYAGFTIYRTGAWKNKETLFMRDIGHLSNSAHAQSLVGSMYVNKMLFEDQDMQTKEKHVQEAEIYLDRSLAISKNFPVTWEAKGICELFRNNNPAALEYFRKAATIDSTYLSGFNYMGVAFRNMGQVDSARYYFTYVMHRENYYGYAADNLVQLLLNNRRYAEADSLIHVLYGRFPNDVNFAGRVEALRSGSRQ